MENSRTIFWNVPERFPEFPTDRVYKGQAGGPVSQSLILWASYCHSILYIPTCWDIWTIQSSLAIPPTFSPSLDTWIILQLYCGLYQTILDYPLDYSPSSGIYRHFIRDLPATRKNLSQVLHSGTADSTIQWNLPETTRLTSGHSTHHRNYSKGIL